MKWPHLRCKEPHRVRNEIRAHMIAPNLVRQLMCEAAMKGKVRPWQISFKNTMQTLNEMLPILSAIEDHGRICETMLDCCLKHVVGNRPDRIRTASGLTKAKVVYLDEQASQETNTILENHRVFGG